MKDVAIVAEAYYKSVELLKVLKETECGLRSTINSYNPALFTRDNIIAYFGALLVDNGALFNDSVKSGFDIIKDYQTELGLFPNAYYFKEGLKKQLKYWSEYAGVTGFADYSDIQAEFSDGNGGCIDSNSLYTIGKYYHYRITGDLDFLKKDYESLHKALNWTRCQDQNNCGLIEAQEAADWADVMPNRYNSLMANVLFYAQIKSFARISEVCGKEYKKYDEMALDVKKKINFLFWVSNDEKTKKEILSISRKWHRVLHEFSNQMLLPYYLPYVSFEEYGEYMDTFGNLLTIIFGIANQERESSILNYIKEKKLNKPYPLRALDPPIKAGDYDWRRYMLGRNMPYIYHNGGIWPPIGGFYIAALVKTGRISEAEEEIVNLAKLNKLSSLSDKGWGFPEYTHGITGVPMGASGMAWNAGMFIFAYECIKNKKVPVFDSF